MPIHGLAQADIPNILVAAGVLFLFISIVGEVSGKFDADTKGRLAGGLLGPILIISGLLLSTPLGGPFVMDGASTATASQPAMTTASHTDIEQSTLSDTETDTDTPTPVDPGQTEFLQSIYEGEAGDEVEISISLGVWNRLYLVVGNEEETNFVVEAWIRDGSGDHDITVILDTDAPNSDFPILRPKDPDDRVNITREAYSSDLGNLAAGTYELRLYEDGFQSSEIDVAALSLHEPG